MRNVYILIIHINNYHYPGTTCVITIFCHFFSNFPLLRTLRCAQPSTIPQLKKVVEEFFDSLSPDFINNCVGNIRRRAELCIKSKGGHFEHLL